MKINNVVAHPWHGVSCGDKAPTYVNAIIEIPRGSRVKYEIDKQTGLLRVDRILHDDITYPCNYGFVPRTYAQDNDPLDIIVFCSESITPLGIVEVRVIGGISMIDGGMVDDKIIGVIPSDPDTTSIHELHDMIDFEREMIKIFFSTYKIPEYKKTEVRGFLSAQQTHEIIVQSIKAYEGNF